MLHFSPFRIDQGDDEGVSNVEALVPMEVVPLVPVEVVPLVPVEVVPLVLVEVVPLVPVEVVPLVPVEVVPLHQWGSFVCDPLPLEVVLALVE